MKAYATQSIRNVGIAGHGDTGKTQLVSSLLFTAGMTTRLGKVAEGNTVTDWDEEEIARKITIHSSLAYAEWAPSGQATTTAQAEKIKINFLDTPGYSTFLNDTRASLVAADAALIVVDALAGVQVVTEKVWDYAIEYDVPRAFVINWMDRDLANYDRAMESITRVFGRNVVPLQLPIGAEKTFRGSGGAGEVLRLQRAEIEKEHDEAAVANLLANFFRRGDRTDGDGYGGGIGGFGLLDFFDIVIFEGGDFLFVPILGNGELVLAQVLDGLAVLAGDLDIDLDELDGGANGALGVRGGLRRRGRRSGLAGILREVHGRQCQGQNQS